MDLSMATCNAERATMKSSEYRKVIKPLLERRRRARINNCLDELKALILETAQPENTDASKLEKADILELTVQHLRSLRHGHRRPWATQPATNDGLLGDKFRAGFAECAHEVSTFVSALSGVDGEVKSRLVSHLSHCINRIPAATVHHPQTGTVLPPSPQQTPPHFIDAATAQHLNRIPVSTPTPPPSPMTTCGTPTISVVSDYVVPVSPISPVETSSYHAPYAPAYARRGDVYVWPTDVSSAHRQQRTVSRASSVDSPSDEYSDREDVVPVASPRAYYLPCRPVAEIGAHVKPEEKSCWRPW